MSIMFIHSQFSAAPNDGFLLNTLKALFRLSRVTNFQIVHISRALKFVSVSHPTGGT